MPPSRRCNFTILSSLPFIGAYILCLHRQRSMPRQNTISLIYLGLAIFMALASLARASNAPMQALPDSVRPVAAAPPAGPLDPHKPWITRQTLTSTELAAPLDFEVALKMRNFAELQSRINRGEIISPQEMAAKYSPLASDYQA